jgi:hypothetical protein
MVKRFSVLVKRGIQNRKKEIGHFVTVWKLNNNDIDLFLYDNKGIGFSNIESFRYISFL